LVDIDNQVLSAGNSRQVLSVEDTGIPPKTFKQETMKPSQISRQDMNPTTSSQAFMDAIDRKIYSGAASSAGHCKDPIDGPSHPSIQRKNMSSDQKIKVSGNDKPKFHPGSVSTSCNGNHDRLSNNVFYFFSFVVTLIMIELSMSPERSPVFLSFVLSE
jgi:hypothetical protein